VNHSRWHSQAVNLLNHTSPFLLVDGEEQSLDLGHARGGSPTVSFMHSDHKWLKAERMQLSGLAHDAQYRSAIMSVQRVENLYTVCLALETVKGLP
jgi:hypothetical protein